MIELRHPLLVVIGFVLTLSLGLLARGASGNDPQSEELKLLQGTWQIASIEKEGMAEEVDSENPLTLIFKGNRIIVNDETELTFQLDTTTSPKLIDFTHVKGNDKGQVIEGVYRLEKDTFSICITEDRSRKERPTAVRTVAGDGNVLLVLRRVLQ